MRTGNVIAVVCDTLNIEPGALLRENGGRRADAYGRRAAAWLMATYCGTSHAEIGRALGYADHSSVGVGIKAIEEKCAADPVFARLMRSMGQRICDIADDHGFGLTDVEQIAREMVTNRRRLLDARMWEVRAVADAVLALAEVARTAVEMIQNTDEAARAALAEAILDEMRAMTGAELNTPKEGETDGNA